MTQHAAFLPAKRESPRRNPVHRFVRSWGATHEELEMSSSCDRFVPPPHDVSVRGIDIDAPKDIVWRWLCQIRIAPYSYDWLDNAGHQSPLGLIPGVEKLELGQSMMMTRPWCIFRLVEFEPEEHMTLQTSPTARFVWGKARSFWGNVAYTYVLVPRGPDRCRLRIKTVGRAYGGISQRLRNLVFPVIEAFMMRKHLLTLKELSERHAQGDVPRTPERRPWYKRRPVTAPST
jgi:hypothetical protein